MWPNKANKSDSDYRREKRGMGRLHIAQIGTGRVGRPTAYTITCSKIADELTVCDVKPGLASAFAEELRHVTASIGLDVEINSCSQDEDVNGADIILISAGKPRTPGVKMTRRDLAMQNGKIIKQVSEATVSHNPGAKYVVITNPVDAMAMVCKKNTKANFVISTGTNLESLRFRSKIARSLEVPVVDVEGWVGGEHGDAAFPLWSTTTVSHLPIDDYVASRKLSFSKNKILSYVKAISKYIVDNIGGTEFGPAASFRDIVKAIVNNTGEIIPVSAPHNFSEIEEPVFVGVPVHLGSAVGASLYNILPTNEQEAMIEAAKAIYQTYSTAMERL
jgi:malate dehydrogenase